MVQTIVEIQANSGGGHNNQSIYNAYMRVPEGWAYLPESIATSATQYYPFANIETKKVSKAEAGEEYPIAMFGNRDEIDVVTVWDPVAPPPPKPYVPPTIRVDRLYRVGEIFTAPDNIMYRITMDIPANGAIAVGTNCEVVTLTELLEN